MIDTNSHRNQAELAQASYARLQLGPTDSPSNLFNLGPSGRGGMSFTQATEFAKRYLTVMAVYDDDVNGANTGFQAAVFRDTAGNLTVAIRGTEGVTDIPTDLSIALSGAGYEQIVAMANWWRRITTPSGENAIQHRFATYPTDAIPEGSVVIRPGDVSSIVLEEAPPAPGEDLPLSGQRVDVVGHSLGGHLAMAFSTIFAEQVNEVGVFNAPGFITDFTNQAFLAKLGGSIPLGASITNVIADEALIGDPPFNAVAGRRQHH